MTLYHIASRTNCPSIDATGLDPQRAVNKERAVWLVTRSNVAWALAHTAAKPGRGGVNDLVVYTCQVPRRKLRRYRKGIWRCYETVRPVACTGSETYTQSYPS